MTGPTRPARRHLLVAAVVAAAGLTATACGVPVGPPVALSKSNAPGLFSPTVPTTIPVGVQVQVFLLDTSLVPTPVTRYVGVHAGLTSVLAALVAGPSTTESDTTAIPVGTTIESVQIQNTTVTVNLSAAFALVSGQSQVQAVEQVVYTVATWLKRPSTGVLFEVDGLPTPVPTITPGSFVSDPVTVANYPLPTGTTTTTTTTAPAGAPG